jgi:hypothetical protein
MPVTTETLNAEISRILAARGNRRLIFQLTVPWTREDVKQSYRRLVRIFHPDRHTDEAVRKKAQPFFVVIQESYEALTKPRPLNGAATNGASKKTVKIPRPTGILRPYRKARLPFQFRNSAPSKTPYRAFRATPWTGT